MHALAVAHERVGRALNTRGDLGAAHSAYDASESILDDMVERKPQETKWMEELRAVRQNHH